MTKSKYEIDFEILIIVIVNHPGLLTLGEPVLENLLLQNLAFTCYEVTQTRVWACMLISFVSDLVSIFCIFFFLKLYIFTVGLTSGNEPKEIQKSKIE